MDVEVFESGKKKLQILICPDTCGWGLNSHTNYFCENWKKQKGHLTQIRVGVLLTSLKEFSLQRSEDHLCIQ